jgi:hypothetical protein
VTARSAIIDAIDALAADPSRALGRAGFAGYLAGVALVTALAFRLELDVTVRAMLVLVPPLTMLVWTIMPPPRCGRMWW